MYSAEGQQRRSRTVKQPHLPLTLSRIFSHGLCRFVLWRFVADREIPSELLAAVWHRMRFQHNDHRAVSGKSPDISAHLLGHRLEVQPCSECLVSVRRGTPELPGGLAKGGTGWEALFAPRASLLW